MTQSSDGEQLRAVVEKHLPDVLRVLEGWVGLSSHTLAPQDVTLMGQVVARHFEPLGFEAEFVDAADKKFGAHLFLKRTGNGPALALVAHNDTVYTREEELAHEFKWQPEGTRIYGPGTSDDK